ncbi:MAG: hypothetical protein ABI769_03025 [Pseudomonadota bacterium]
MPGIRYVGLIVCLCGLFAAHESSARTATPRIYVDEKTRDIVGGRKVLIILRSRNLQPTIQRVPIDTSTTYGGDIIIRMTQIDYEQYLKDIEAARAIGAPLLAKLGGLISDRVRSTVEKSAWLGAQDVEITADGSPRNLEQELNASNTRQMLVVLAESLAEFRYLAITVTLKATLLVRQIPRGKRGYVRLEQDYIPYQMVFTAVANLADADRKDPQRNRDRWGAEDGKLAREAMNQGIAFVIEHFARNLDETEATSAVWRTRRGRPGRLANGRAGWIIESGKNRTVVFDAMSRTLILETQLRE